MGALIQRGRLFNRFEGQARAVVVHAATGFGKTTLAREWVRNAQHEAVIWVTLNAQATSRRSFWHTVALNAARVGRLDAGAADGIDSHLDPIPALIDAIGHCSAVLVIDAYEKIGAASDRVDEDLGRLMEALPNLRIIVTTRGGTSLANSARRLRGEVDVIGESDLAFTVEETAECLAAFSSGTGAANIANVHRETGGYPLAVRAVGLAISNQRAVPVRSASNWRLIVADYFFEELGAADRDFILDTAASPYFDMEFAERVTSDDASARLRSLEDKGFGRWIPWDERRQVFQYVESVRDAVRYHLEASDPSRFARTARVAALWLDDNGEYIEAFELALAAGAYSDASVICRRVFATTPESYTTQALVRSLATIPRAELMKWPVLAMAFGLALVSDSSTRGAAAPFFEIAVDLGLQDIASLEEPEAIFHRTMRVVAQRCLGRYQDAGTNAAQTAALIPVDRAELAPDFWPHVLRHLAFARFEVAEFTDARRLIDEGIVAAPIASSLNYTLSHAIGFSAFKGDLPHARTLVAKVDDSAWPRDHEHTYLNALGKVGRAALYLDDFEASAALAEFDGCESFIDVAEFWPYIQWARLHAHLRLGTGQGFLLQLDDALDSSPPPPGYGDNLGLAALRATQAIGWILLGRQSGIRTLTIPKEFAGQWGPAAVLAPMMRGDFRSALKQVSRFDGVAGHTYRSIAATTTLGAAAAMKAGEDVAAKALLARAVAIHRQHGPQLHLAYLTEDLADGLRDFVAEHRLDDAQDYLAKVPHDDLPVRALERHLSRSEVKLLGRFRSGQTRAEVARSLHVSENTVKTQLSSAYRKLGVGSLPAALHRARELGLLK